MELSAQDSVEALRAMGTGGAGGTDGTPETDAASGADGADRADGDARPAVVYLDPMSPARRKSAAVKNKFQLLHHLESPCEDAETLLQAALSARPRKVVVKRPPKGPHLAGVKPSYALSGKAVRYDVIALPERG